MRKLIPLPIILGALVSVFACDTEPGEHMGRPQFPIDFRLAVRPGSDACDGCSSFSYEGVLGESQTVLARIKPDLTLKPANLHGIRASADPDGFGVMLITDREGAARLADLADKALEEESILVSVRDQSLGTFSPSLLKASHGNLGFSFSREESFNRVLEALGGEHLIDASTDEELMAVCSRISDSEERKRCELNTWSQVRREKESLRKVKDLLESGTEEDRNAAIEEVLRDW